MKADRAVTWVVGALVALLVLLLLKFWGVL